MLEKVLLFAELLLALMFLAAFPVLNLGNLTGLVLCAIAAALTADMFGLRTALCGAVRGSTAGKIVACAVGLLLIAGTALCVLFSVNMTRGMNNAPRQEPKLIIVLGCQVRGDRPSKMLARRINTAYEAMQRYPGVMVVVSGGKGGDEDISEAECMKRYLVDKGADPARIIMEDKSTTTFENIQNSFAVTDPLGLGRDVTIVTDGFHQYRASLIAKKMGAAEVTAISARTELRFVPTYWVREWLALAEFFVFKSRG